LLQLLVSFRTCDSRAAPVETSEAAGAALIEIRDEEIVTYLSQLYRTLDS